MFRGCPQRLSGKAIDKKAGVLVDTRRTMLAFGGGHIPGALNLGGTPILSIWAGWMLDPEKPILLVLEDDDDLEGVIRLFLRTGYTRFADICSAGTATPQRSSGATMRPDTWWTQPRACFSRVVDLPHLLDLGSLSGALPLFRQLPLISPFYSPELLGNSPHAWFGAKPVCWPGWLPFSPALLILWAPGGHSGLTCYYYRGAYCKSFWADPPACTVGEPRKTYLGERHFPLIIQNVHRYFLYVALVSIIILAFDAWKALWFANPATGESSLGLGVGTIVLAINVVLLGGYTFGCHSLRHLVGGFLDQFSKAPACYKAYACVSCFNRRHMLWAWMSLFWVGFSDLYVRLCSMGIWHDWRIF